MLWILPRDVHSVRAAIVGAVPNCVLGSEVIVPGAAAGVAHELLQARPAPSDAYRHARAGVLVRSGGSAQGTVLHAHTTEAPPRVRFRVQECEGLERAKWLITELG